MMIGILNFSVAKYGFYQADRKDRGSWSGSEVNPQLGDPLSALSRLRTPYYFTGSMLLLTASYAFWQVNNRYR